MGLVLLVTVVIFFVRSDFQRALCYDKSSAQSDVFFCISMLLRCLVVVSDAVAQKPTQ